MNLCRTSARMLREFQQARAAGPAAARALRRLDRLGRPSVAVSLPCALLRLQARQPAVLPLLGVVLVAGWWKP